MKKFRVLIVLLISNACLGQTVSTLTSSYTLEYECLEGWGSSYTKDLLNTWVVTGLVTNQTYLLTLTRPTVVCGSSAIFPLSNLPSFGASASWVIKQNGYTRASGTGTTASATNLTNGDAEVNFTVTFSCGLTPLYLTQDFWVGVPIPTITGEQYPECYDRNWYFLDPEDQWGTYSWNMR